MTIAHGFSVVTGIGSESTLGTPVASTQKICIISESLAEVIQEVLDNSLCGTAVRSIGQQGTRQIAGGYVHQLRVDLGAIQFIKFFGTTDADTPNVGQTAYSLDNSIDGDGYTVSIDKQVSVYEFAGYKASSMVISGNPGDGIRVTWDGFATSLNLDSVINTTAVLAALGEGGTFFLFQDTTFRIADLADALQTSDRLQISEFSLEVNRNLEPVEVNSHNRTEALENNFRESKLTFAVPRYQSDFIIDAHRNHTKLQADLVFTNGTAIKTIQMPKMIVTEYSNNAGGPEYLKINVTCQLFEDSEGDNAFITLENTMAELQLIEED